MRINLFKQLVGLVFECAPYRNGRLQFIELIRIHEAGMLSVEIERMLAGTKNFLIGVRMHVSGRKYQLIG